MIYDVCWQGLLEECELFLELLRASCWEVSEEMYPLFLFGKSNISHCTCTGSCTYMEKLKALWVVPTDVPTLWPLVKCVCVCVLWGGIVPEATATFPWQERETIALIGPDGQNSWNRWNCEPTLLFPSALTIVLAVVEDIQYLNFWGDAKWMRKS